MDVEEGWCHYQKTISFVGPRHDIVLLENTIFCCQFVEIWNQIFLKCPLINYRVYPMTCKGYGSSSATWKTSTGYYTSTCKLSFIENQIFLPQIMPIIVIAIRDILVPFFSSEKRTLFHCSFHPTLFMAHSILDDWCFRDKHYILLTFPYFICLEAIKTFRTASLKY